MGKISRAVAYTAALKITEPIKYKADQLLREISEYVESIYLKEIPSDVKEVFEKFPEYIDKNTGCYVSGPGLSSTYYVKFKKFLPSKNGYSANLLLNNKESVKLIKMKDEQEDLNAKYKKTTQEIEETILALGTHKKVAENMPEALRFLPEVVSINTGLIISIEPVREKVKCLTNTSEDKKCMENI